MDDGTEMDSRQDIAGDDGCLVVTKSLATSWLWWQLVAPLVQRIAASGSGDGYALVIGPRSVASLSHDDRIKRTRLRGLLNGGTETLTIDHTTTEFPAGQAPWRFLSGNDWHLRDLDAGSSPPAVVVDTTPAFPDHPAVYPQFEGCRLLSPGSVLVMPHTARADRFVRGYAKWLAQGRIAPPPGRHIREWQLQEARGPIRYAQLVPIDAEFGVTGLVRDGRWVDPAELEAARSLLHTRFDLQLGLWDLADNPVLRSTLLKTTP